MPVPHITGLSFINKPGKIKHRRNTTNQYTTEDLIRKVSPPKAPEGTPFSGWMPNTRTLDNVKKPPNITLPSFKRNMPDLDPTTSAKKQKSTKEAEEKEWQAKAEQLKKLVEQQKCAFEMCLSDIKYRTARDIHPVLKTRLAKVLSENNDCGEMGCVVPLSGEIKEDQEIVKGKPPILEQPEVKIECIVLSDDEDEVPQQPEVKEEIVEKRQEKKTGENEETLTLYRSEDNVNSQEDVQAMADTLTPMQALAALEARLEVIPTPQIQVHQNIVISQAQTIIAEVPTISNENLNTTSVIQSTEKTQIINEVPIVPVSNAKATENTEIRQIIMPTIPVYNANLNAGNNQTPVIRQAVVEVATVPAVPAEKTKPKRQRRSSVYTDSRKTVTAATVTPVAPRLIAPNNQTIQQQHSALFQMLQGKPPVKKAPSYTVNESYQRITTLISRSVCAILEIHHYNNDMLKRLDSIKYSEAFKLQQIQAFQAFTGVQYQTVVNDLMENLIPATNRMIYNNSCVNTLLNNVELYVRSQFPKSSVTTLVVHNICDKLLGSHRLNLINPFVNAFIQRIKSVLDSVELMRCNMRNVFNCYMALMTYFDFSFRSAKNESTQSNIDVQ